MRSGNFAVFGPLKFEKYWDCLLLSTQQRLNWLRCHLECELMGHVRHVLDVGAGPPMGRGNFGSVRLPTHLVPLLLHLRFGLGWPLCMCTNYIYLLNTLMMPSLLWRCWLGVRKGIGPVKIWVMRCWCGYLWSKVQIACVWFSWCHCHSIISASAKSRMAYPSGTDSPG